MRDEALDDAFARRDAAAYERAYALFSSRMYTTALRILRDEDLARECVHDVMLRLWRSGSGYTSARGSLEAFLVVCARNAALARVRDDARRRAILAAQPPQPEARVDADPLEHEHVASALARLTALQSESVRLAYYAGMTHTEIAEHLHEPVGTIKSRISSALRSLRTLLTEEVKER